MKKVVLAIAIIIVMLLFVSCNIKMYGIYYAKYTPHTGTSEPVLQMLVDNMEYIDEVEKDKFNYDYDGADAIIVEGTGVIFGQLYGDVDKYIYIDEKDYGYFFDENFIMVGVAGDSYSNKVNIKDIDSSSVISSIYTTFQPIIDAQPSPLINLQWIFDIVYHKKFNQ